MGEEHSHSDTFRGASFQDVDLSGASFRECDLSGVRIVGSVVAGLRVESFAGRLGQVLVDDVDVTPYVEAELDRRLPERVPLRAMRTADEHRAVWALVERSWASTLEQAAGLPDDLREQRVDQEWSLVETLRHLVFAVDVWVGRMLRDDPAPFHPLGLPPTDYPAAGAAELGIDLAAHPSYDEVLAAHAGRRAQVGEVLADLADADLAEVRTAAPTPEWGTESHTVAACLRVVMGEHVEHRRYVLRDLAVLTARR